MIVTSILIVNYNQLNDVTGTARSLSKKISKRIDDYSGIKRNISGISTNRNNLSQSNYYIEKKIQKLREKVERIDNFSRAVSDFRDDVKEADKRVARRIKDDTNLFKKVNDIHISVFAYIGVGLEDLAKAWFGRDFVNMFNSAVRSIKYDIKDWYHDEGGKYYVGIVKDAAALALAILGMVSAIASGAGVFALFFAGFSLYKSVADYSYDIVAASQWKITGNRVLADRLDDSGGRELTCMISGGMMEGIAVLFDQDREEFREAGKAAGGLVYGGLQIAETIYGIKSLKNFLVGKKFSFDKFYSDLCDNAQKGSLTAQDIFLENVKDASLVKMYKDFKIQSVLVDGNGRKLEMLVNSFNNNWVKEDWHTLDGIYDNIDSIKGFIDDGIKGGKTYMYPIKFEDKIKNSIKDIGESVKKYVTIKTKITPLPISV